MALKTAFTGQARRLHFQGTNRSRLDNEEIPKMKGTPPNLVGLIGDLAKAGRDQDEVSLRDLRAIVGRRSFAPLLLTVSLIGFTPLGGVPGVPTILAALIVLIALQIIIGLDSLWLPQFILNRKVNGQKLRQAAKSLEPAARVIDKAIRPRLTFLTDRPFLYVIALICISIALTVPPLELVPFVDLPLWGALAAFSLALAAHDGLLAVAAFILTGMGFALLGIALL
jgi:hypothetical protein